MFFSKETIINLISNDKLTIIGIYNIGTNLYSYYHNTIFTIIEINNNKDNSCYYTLKSNNNFYIFNNQDFIINILKGIFTIV